MFGIPTLDLIVLGGYSLLTLAIGVMAMLRVRNQEDFFLGGRRFGKIFMLFSSFGQATSSDNAVGAVTTTFRDGAGGLWSQLTALWATPFYWFTAPWYRRMRLLTLGDFFAERYQSRRMAMVYSALASVFLVLIIGLGLKSLSVTVLGVTLKPVAALSSSEQVERSQALRIETLTHAAAQGQIDAAQKDELHSLRLHHPRREFSYINETWLIWSIVLVVFLYGITGGLEAAVWVDVMQGTLILVLSVILIPFAIVRLNGLHGTTGLLAGGKVLHQELPGHFFAPLGSAQAAEFTWYFVIALCAMATLNVAVQANQFTANAAARDEFSASVGFTTGNLIKRYCTVAWGLVGLLCAALYGREIQNPDLVWGHATRDLLGSAGYGLLGLVIACLLAALQSTASTLMISASALFTKNIYEPLVPRRTEKHYVFVGRAAGALVLILAALSSTAFDTILGMLKFMWEFNVIVAASFWCGLKWRRATRAGAWSSMLAALLLFVALPIGLPTVFPSLRTHDALLRMTQERVLLREYTATQRDMDERHRLIAEWTGPGAAPAPVTVGETMQRSLVQPPRAIFWAEGIQVENEQARGGGMLHIEMVALDRIVDLSRNPYAFNETIRYAYKILLPFIVLIVVSRMTQPDDSRSVQRFFLRMRTKVRRDREDDERAVQAAYDVPASTTKMLLWPRSHLEFYTWDRTDAIGFGTACVGTLGVIGALWLVVGFGA